MLVKIRLRRTGAKKQPSYRLVVAPSTAPRDGRFIEIIGNYNPLTDPPTIKVDVDKAQRWLSQGAQPTEAAAKLLRKAGVEVGGAKAQTTMEENLPTPREIEAEGQAEEQSEEQGEEQ